VTVEVKHTTTYCGIKYQMWIVKDFENTKQKILPTDKQIIRVSNQVARIVLGPKEYNHMHNLCYNILKTVVIYTGHLLSQGQ